MIVPQPEQVPVRRIAVLGYHFDNHLTTPEALLEAYHATRGVWEAIAALGVEVAVYQRFHQSHSYSADGVTYQFVADSFAGGLRYWGIPLAFHQLAARDHADVFHTNSYYPLQTALLRRRLPVAAAMVTQDHAAAPPRGLRRVLATHLLRQTDAFVFVSKTQGQGFVDAGVAGSIGQIHEVMEASTRFSPGDQGLARRETGLTGDPVVLWVGRLNANKDPLCALAGFRQACADNPGARLYMITHETDLEADVRAWIQAANMQHAVTIVGQVAHGQMQAYYNSADYFLLGSHHEGSGFALAEAMACGVIPVVTDIPSFAKMTGGGRYGALWQPGDPESCAAALAAAFDQPRSQTRQDVRALFEQTLSFEAIARDSLQAYQSAVAHRRAYLDR